MPSDDELNEDIDIDLLQDQGRVLTGVAVAVNTLVILLPLDEGEDVRVIFVDGEGEAKDIPVSRPILDVIKARLESAG